MSMSGVPADRVVIDLDCGTLQLHDTPRCDFLFVGADSDGTRVAPIELKNGRFSGSKVADQLQGGRECGGRMVAIRMLVPVRTSPRSWERYAQDST